MRNLINQVSLGLEHSKLAIAIGLYSLENLTREYKMNKNKAAHDFFLLSSVLPSKFSNISTSFRYIQNIKNILPQKILNPEFFQ